MLELALMLSGNGAEQEIECVKGLAVAKWEST